MDLLERVRQVRAIWNWLPAFRAVAETQHIHRASRLLSISPSALSRSIRLLEDRLGEPLFERRGRMLVLTSAGEEFLDAVRDSIRRVDDGVCRVTSGELAGSVYLLSASSVVDAFLVPALCTLRRQSPKLVPHLHRFSTEDISHRILGGQLDIAFGLSSAVDRRLSVDLLGYATSGIYCGPGHPFFGCNDIPLPAIFEQTFAVIVLPGTESPCDGWPGHPRKIGIYVSDAALACQACQEDRMLAALPDAVVAVFASQGSPLSITSEPAR